VQAVILAAGEGTRLQPLTSTRSKHMFPFIGKPLLEHLIDALRENGITDIILVTGYRETLLKDYFHGGSPWNVHIQYVHQDKYLGSGHAIGCAEPLVTDDFFLTLYGDLLVHPDAISALLHLHQTHHSPVMSVVQVTNPHHYGVTLIKNGKVTRLIEKPQTASYGKLVNAGLYIFPKSIFPVIHTTPKSPRGELEITDTIQTLIEDQIPFLSNELPSGHWLDIGRPWDLFTASKRLLSFKTPMPQIQGDIEPGASIHGPVHIAKGARIRSGVYIEGPVYIGPHADIGPNTYIRPYTNIENDVRLGHACEVKNSIILSETHIGHLSYIGDSIIGARCNFGAGTITANLRFDEANINVQIKDQLLDSGRRKLGVIMGDNVKTGINVLFMPGIKIGSNAWIGPGAQVSADVPPGYFYRQSKNGTMTLTPKRIGEYE
jgi:UDP-N-acetylglucosamine diphosphorylase/glucosamine-1-phosphate N-acetyltransferase